MRIRINGVDSQAPDGATLLALLGAARVAPGRVAVEINGRTVSRADFERVEVREGDVVEIVQFVGGG